MRQAHRRTSGPARAPAHGYLICCAKQAASTRGMDMGFLDDVKKAAQDAQQAVQRQVDNLQKPPAPPEPPPVDGPATTAPLEPPLMAGAPPEAPVAPAPF